MINTDLEARALPPILLADTTAENWPLRRKELISLFASNEYGYSPAPPADVHAVIRLEEPEAWAGKAVHREVIISFPTPGGEFPFPMDLVLPVADKMLPLIIYMSFTKYPIGGYAPLEEIIDSGYALATFCYNDVTEDWDDGFTSGLAGKYGRNNDDGSQWGKIAMWAWAASRVMDYAQTLDGIDKSRIICCGHSRLGKTAIWCAVQDERFAAAASNESGCSGAAITRGKQGERIENIATAFPHWFCKNYFQYKNNEQSMPFDQHQLLAAMAPRPLYVASASGDIWADPTSEFLACVEASKAYRLLGLPGLVHRGQFIEPGEYLHDGSIGYHLRPGAHFFSRQDWQLILRFMDQHLG